MLEVRNEAELRQLVGEPAPAAVAKERSTLHALDREWLAASPFCLMATAAPDGSCDVSPKGDPAGFTLVLDDTTIAIPERPGNRRTDGFRNILANPHVGLLYLIPGRGDTLRINGRATLVRDAPFFDDMVVRGHRPTLAVVVQVEQVFTHCSKAFLRSHLWEPDTWAPDQVPATAVFAHTLARKDEPFEDVRRYYESPAYAASIYGSGGQVAAGPAQQAGPAEQRSDRQLHDDRDDGERLRRDGGQPAQR